MLPFVTPMLMKPVAAIPAPLFRARFAVSPPVDEIGSSTGTLVGNATADTANSRLTLDGTGDWCTFPSNSVFDLAGDFTLSVHCDVAAAQVGGIIGRTESGVGNVGRYVMYCNGNGTLDFYADNITGGIIVGFGAAALNGSEHHLVVCREGNVWRSYRDGVQKQSATFAGTIGTQSKALYIGTDPFSTATRDILANIGRVAIYNSCIYPGGTSFTPPARTDP